MPSSTAPPSTSTSSRVRRSPERDVPDVSSVSGDVVGVSEAPTTPPISTLPVTGFSVLPLVAVRCGRGEEVRRGAGEGVAVRVAVGLGVGLAVGVAVGATVTVGLGPRQIGAQGVGLGVGLGDSAVAVPGTSASTGTTTAAAASRSRRRDVIGTARW